MALFPDVPIAPGVPAILRDPLALAVGAIPVLASQALSLLYGAFGPQWGLFQFGVGIIVADQVTSFEYRQDWTIADYPVEQGGFASYDKVPTPFACRLRFTTGGSELDRHALLTSIAIFAGSTETFDAVTPEAVYQNVCISHYDYRRTATNGLGLLQVDVWCNEVRQGSSLPGFSTQSPSAANITNDGTVQPTLPTSAQTGSVTFVN